MIPQAHVRTTSIYSADSAILNQDKQNIQKMKILDQK